MNSDTDTDVYNLSMKDVIKYIVHNKYKGNRIKHYKKIMDYQMYNERDKKVKKNGWKKFGSLNIRKNGTGEFISKNFKKFGINIKQKHGGIEDPRYFVWRKQAFVIMNGLDNNKRRNMYLYNLNKKHFCKLYISNYNISKLKTQKNWIPYIYHNKLYIIYSFKQLCVLKLVNSQTGECYCVKGNPLKFNNNFDFFGSTPLIKWNNNVYVGFAHTRGPHLSVPVVYNAKQMKIINFGKPIDFTNPKEAIPWRGKKVQFPYDLVINKNSVILSIEFEDRCPTEVFIKYSSFQKAFESLM